jgi:hypothetical protein
MFQFTSDIFSVIRMFICSGLTSVPIYELHVSNPFSLPCSLEDLKVCSAGSLYNFPFVSLSFQIRQVHACSDLAIPWPSLLGIPLISMLCRLTIPCRPQQRIPTILSAWIIIPRRPRQPNLRILSTWSIIP